MSHSPPTIHERKGQRSRRLLNTINKFPKTKVLVVGDVMLDHFIWGTVDRISPEAPVPVVHVESESLCPGGAANVFTNLQALGGNAELCGVIGKDESGQALLKQLGISPKQHKGIVIDQDRPTTKKTRIVAHSQQVVRYDIERQHDTSRHITKRILGYIQSHLSNVSCLIVSDYAKGVITAPLMSELGRMARDQQIPLVVDPKVCHFPYYAGVTVMTPNHLEAQRGAALTPDTGDSVSEIGHHLRQKLGCQAVLVTRGEQGMTLCEATGSSWHIPAMARQVYDVTGAGDTVVSTLALALGTGASIQDSAILANHAAGLVVGMVGTATVTASQLQTAIHDAYK